MGKKVNVGDVHKKILELRNAYNISSRVHYYVYNDPKDDLGILSKDELESPSMKKEPYLALKNTNAACFAQFTYAHDFNHRSARNELLDKRNRVAYIIPNGVFEKFGKSRVVEWLKLCMGAKMLPDYVDPEKSAEKRSIVIKIDQKNPKMSPSLLFVYLSVLRDLSEHCKNILLIFFLLKEYELDFTIAYVTANKLLYTYNHSFFKFKMLYGQSDSDNAIPLNYLVGLRKYLMNPNKYDKRKMVAGLPFRAAETIESVFGSNQSIPLGEIGSSYVLKESIRASKSRIKDTSKFFKKYAN